MGSLLQCEKKCSVYADERAVRQELNCAYFFGDTPTALEKALRKLL